MNLKKQKCLVCKGEGDNLVALDCYCSTLKKYHLRCLVTCRKVSSQIKDYKFETKVNCNFCGYQSIFEHQENYNLTFKEILNNIFYKSDIRLFALLLICFYFTRKESLIITLYHLLSFFVYCFLSYVNIRELKKLFIIILIIIFPSLYLKSDQLDIAILVIWSLFK